MHTEYVNTSLKYFVPVKIIRPVKRCLITKKVFQGENKFFVKFWKFNNC